MSGKSLCTSTFTFQSSVHSSHVLRCLDEQRQKDVLCDVTVVVENSSFRAHRSVLASCCQYFHARVSGPVGQGLVLTLPPEVTAEGFEPLLQFAYTSKLLFTKENILEIQNCATILGFHNLDKACFEFLLPKFLNNNRSAPPFQRKTCCKAKRWKHRAVEKGSQGEVDLHAIQCVDEEQVESKPQERPVSRAIEDDMSIICGAVCPERPECQKYCRLPVGRRSPPKTTSSRSDPQIPSGSNEPIREVEPESKDDPKSEQPHYSGSATSQGSEVRGHEPLPMHARTGSVVQLNPAHSERPPSRSSEEREVAEHLAEAFWEESYAPCPSGSVGSDGPFLHGDKAACSGSSLQDESSGLNSGDDSDFDTEGDSESCSSVRAPEVQLPFPAHKIISLSRNDFQQLLRLHSLSRHQLEYVQDVRRRSKNRIAAHMCRKRKLDCIHNLECEIVRLKGERERLVQEHNQLSHQKLRTQQSLTELYRRLCHEAKLQPEQLQLLAKYSSSLTASTGRSHTEPPKPSLLDL